MAVIVDPLRLDLHHRRQKRRGPEQRIVAGGNASSFIHPRLFDSGLLTPYISFATVGLSREDIVWASPSPINLKRPEPQALAGTLEALAARFGNRLITSQAVRDQHAHTTTWLAPQPPDAVVMAQETADIQDVVRICAQHGVPVIAFGTGTSLEGQVNAPAGGVCIDLRDMNKVLEVHAEDLDCVIQPGVTRKALNEHLRDQGVFFPIDPGADASLGGMASTRASGTNAVRYGTMRDNVLALKVVRGDGEIITTGTRAKKSSAGYDLTHLFVGAEGTLGIISELTIKLRGIPETIAAAACSFETVRGACQATILAIQTGIPVARIELLNAEQVRRLQFLFETVAAGDAAVAAGIPRQRERGRRAIEEFRRDRQGMRRRRFHLDHAAGGSHQTLAGAARRLLVGEGAASRRRRGGDRRLRADFAAGRLRRPKPKRI